MLTTCPQCGHFVRLPVLVSMSAHVRCPLCHHSYALRSVLPIDIPELELMVQGEWSGKSDSFPDLAARSASSNSSERPIPVADRLSIPEVLQRGTKRRGHRRPQRELGDAAGSHVASLDPQEMADISPTDRRDYPRRPVGRRRKATSSSSLELVKVMVGGLLALPVAQLIIWWALGLDPFRMGPAVGRYVPFIVPSRLAEDDTAE